MLLGFRYAESSIRNRVNYFFIRSLQCYIDSAAFRSVINGIVHKIHNHLHYLSFIYIQNRKAFWFVESQLQLMISSRFLKHLHLGIYQLNDIRWLVIYYKFTALEPGYIQKVSNQIDHALRTVERPLNHFPLTLGNRPDIAL